MTPQESIALCVCGDPKCDIPYGFCHCRCGARTSIPRTNDRHHGYIAGRPLAFVRFHGRFIVRPEIASPFKIDGEYCRFIPLGKGLIAIVSENDYEGLMRWKWYAWFHPKTNVFYAVRDDHKKRIYLHRHILGAPFGVLVDHQNGNTLDYRRGNLRLASNAQNLWNRPRQKNNNSGFKGVHWRKDIKKYQVRIRANGKDIQIGVFDKDRIIEAARAYDEAARLHHGQFARLNFPKES